jgi:hypothetical protein
MVFVSKTTALNKKGKVKKGYRQIETTNGRIMYLTNNKKTPIAKNNMAKKMGGKKEVKKEVKKKKVAKKKKKEKKVKPDEVSLLEPTNDIISDT